MGVVPPLWIPEHHSVLLHHLLRRAARWAAFYALGASAPIARSTNDGSGAGLVGQFRELACSQAMYFPAMLPSPTSSHGFVEFASDPDMVAMPSWAVCAQCIGTDGMGMRATRSMARTGIATVPLLSTALCRWSTEVLIQRHLTTKTRFLFSP